MVLITIAFLANIATAAPVAGDAELEMVKRQDSRRHATFCDRRALSSTDAASEVVKCQDNRRHRTFYDHDLNSTDATPEVVKRQDNRRHGTLYERDVPDVEPEVVKRDRSVYRGKCHLFPQSDRLIWSVGN